MLVMEGALGGEGKGECQQKARSRGSQQPSCLQMGLGASPVRCRAPGPPQDLEGDADPGVPVPHCSSKEDERPAPLTAKTRVEGPREKLPPAKHCRAMSEKRPWFTPP